MKLIKLLTTRETNERPGGGQATGLGGRGDLIETDMLMGHLMGEGRGGGGGHWSGGIGDEHNRQVPDGLMD